MTDRKTIGLTPRGRSVIDRIEDSFKERMQAAQFAMAVAIAEGGDVPDADDADTAWNIGSFDPDGALRLLVPSLFPGTTEPYRFIERLVDKGLSVIASRLDAGDELPTIMRDAVSAAVVASEGSP